MARIANPLDPEAVQTADDQLYAAHANDPRPNALYDASGNRKPLSSTDPGQESLREGWRQDYIAAREKNSQQGETTDDSSDAQQQAPAGNNNVQGPVQDCNQHWIQVALLKKPEPQARPKWWPKKDAPPYPSEPYSAEITDGHKTGSLDKKGISKYTGIPAGQCTYQFTVFYKALETKLGPEESWPGIGTTSTPPGGQQSDKIRLAEVAEVVTAQDGTDGNQGTVTRKQYVNMPARNGDAQYGPQVRLKARVEWEGGSTGSLAGQTVHFCFTPDSKNRAGMPAKLQAGFATAGTAEATATTDDQGWTTIVTFLPSQYGGDVFEVFASLIAKSGGLSGGVYTVWRRVYYELDCMQRAGGGSYSDRADGNKVESKLADAFVSAIPTGKDSAPAHQRMIHEADAAAWATSIRNGSGAPRYFHLVIVDTLGADPGSWKETYNLPAGSNTITLPARSYLLDATSWFVSANYSQSNYKGAMSECDFTLSESGSPATNDDAFVITVDFSNTPIDPKYPVQLALTFTKWLSLSGEQFPTGPATIVGVRGKERYYRASPGDIANAVLNTMLHEPGHAMGLAPATLPDGKANGNQYPKAGSHCKALSNGCIMYDTNSTSIVFCPDCTDGLRGRNLKALPVAGTAPY